MSDTTEDPFTTLLRERERELTGVIDDATARREEVRALLTTLGDGRSRVRRRLREASAPGNGAGEQPQESAP